MTIKVLGMGCPGCLRLMENVKSAIKNQKRDDTVEKITDIEEIMKYGVMHMPALVIDEKVVSSGKILSVSEVESLITK